MICRLIEPYGCASVETPQGVFVYECLATGILRMAGWQEPGTVLTKCVRVTSQGVRHEAYTPTCSCLGVWAAVSNGYKEAVVST